MSSYKSLLLGLVLSIVATVVAGPTMAQQLFIYPSRGQSPEQQQQDTFQCSVWASQQTGFNPTAPPPIPQASAPPPAGPFLFGAIRRARYEQEQEAQIAQATAAYNNQRAAFVRAETACLLGRGYTVT